MRGSCRRGQRIMRECQGIVMNNIAGGNYKDQEIYWQWLCSCPLLTRKEISLLMDYFGGPKQLYEAPGSDLDLFRLTRGKWVGSLTSYKDSCSLDKNSSLLHDRGISFCSVKHPLFPRRLTQLPDCPFGIFYKGGLPDPGQLSVAVIGSRRCTNYGAKMAAYLGCQLAKRHVQVISGMASGVDGMSQKACLEEGGRSYAVLGCGADICYPAENNRLYSRLCQQGGVLSEYGPATPPLPANFPLRNRLIAGLADAVVVVEARRKSGSLITVDMALDQGKDVFAVPGRFGEETSYGCNHLIEQGAQLLVSVDQLLDEIGEKENILRPSSQILTAEQIFARRKQEEQREHALIFGGQDHAAEELSDQERCIYRSLGFDSKSFDQLMDETGLPMMQLMQGLLALQMKNYIQEVSRNRYIRAGMSA